jgi:hypothetical protein
MLGLWATLVKPISHLGNVLFDTTPNWLLRTPL